MKFVFKLSIPRVLFKQRIYFNFGNESRLLFTPKLWHILPQVFKTLRPLAQIQKLSGELVPYFFFLFIFSR